MRQMILIVIIGLVCAGSVGCKNIEKLGPGNDMAIANQENLNKNVMRQLDNFEKLAKAQPSWDAAKDQPIFDKQKAVLVEQLATNNAWLLVIKTAIESNDLDPKFFGDLLKELPGWIAAGKSVYDLVKSKGK